MRLFKIISFIIIQITLFSCSGSKKKNEYPAINVNGYLKGQLKILDSVPYGMLKITETANAQADSVYITKKDVWSLVSPFLSNTIEKDRLETDYSESSFADATIEKVVITYDAKDKDAAINQITVYIDPRNGEIAKIYITGYFEKDKWMGKKQLLWMHNKGFTIISSPGNDPTNTGTIIEKIIWQ